MRAVFWLACGLLLSARAWGSPDPVAAGPVIAVPPLAEGEQVVVDGRLDEPVWQRVPAHSQFRVIEPDTMAAPALATRVQLVQAPEGLYLGFYGEQPPASLISRLSSRDNFGSSRDDFSVTVDASGDGRYGYWFTVHLGGSLSDGTVLPERRFRSNWDGPWRGASAELDGGWSAEFFLPWAMMAMPAAEGERRVGLYVSRNVAHLGQRWAWPTLPDTKPVFLSALQPLDLGDAQPSRQFTLYPYASSTWDNVNDEGRWKLGGDLFWRPSTNAQLALTLNPDFGQVEQDDVIVNLSAFETFFPEKRPFFLEGQEIFVTTPRADGRRGQPTTLINTRRIGGAPLLDGLPDDVTLADLEASQPTELQAAGKLTGQLGGLRYGLLAAVEDEVKLDVAPPSQTNLHVDGRDFGALRLLWEGNTAAGAYRALGTTTTAVLHPERDALVQALDLHYLSPAGTWKWDGQVMASRIENHSQGQRSNGLGAFLDGVYVPRQGVTHQLGLEAYDDQLDFNDFGFLRRNDLLGMRYTWRQVDSDHPRFRRVQSRLSTRQAWNGDGKLVLSGFFASRNWGFQDLTFAFVEYGWFPARWDDRNSDGNGSFRIHHRHRLEGGFESNPSSPLVWDIFAQFEHEELGGRRLTLAGGFEWRPSGRLSMGAGGRLVKRDGWLLHQGDGRFTTFRALELRPEAGLSLFFGPRQQLKLSAQWVAIQAEEDRFWRVPNRPGGLVPRAPGPAGADDFSISRLNLQLRYRWEVAPLSDLFVVYTRNGDRDAGRRGLGGLFRDALDEPVAEQLVVKFRYRLGA